MDSLQWGGGAQASSVPNYTTDEKGTNQLCTYISETLKSYKKCHSR